MYRLYGFLATEPTLLDCTLSGHRTACWCMASRTDESEKSRWLRVGRAIAAGEV